MGDLIELPPFVREAFEDDHEAELRVLGEALELGVAAMLEPLPPGPLPLARLEASLEQPVHRYAPFTTRLAQLFDMSEAAIGAELTRLGQQKVWRFAGIPGIQNVVVRGGPRVADAETLFVRFAPGTRFPRHRHLGLEATLVLEGSYTDSAGIVHRQGELRQWAEGSEHSFRVSTDGPCIFASVVFGRRFHARPLRLLARMLGR